jgi:hypothetical protein
LAVVNDPKQEGTNMRDDLLSVGEVARRIGANPKRISDLFYLRKLDDKRCPIVAGRRLIPESYVRAIRAAVNKLEKAEVMSA